MLDITLNWKPDPQTLTQLVQVAIQEQKSLETLLDEAIAQYLQANLTPNPLSPSPTPPDPFLTGLYDGSAELSTQAEAILTAEIQSASGLSWKK
ncbi:hypothetical protein VB712_03780 [Spirulina sp. CCNP1310]|uniref:hypothetical protein n=1 Tax=Spirulina sp. CCNP1310 TaxID=3110249 RepID=UPI002B202653|nr:hypothetical protein [Spirulina sp. CCNP1310]MEA5418332.1 hypothetical protein [Spirulina sp. CCNP1310]